MATIQWYPGHMNKARNQLEDKLNLIDVLVEVLDARIPESSRNPMIEELVGNKPHIIILNKADLADPNLTKEWAKKLSGANKYVLALDSLHNTNMQKLISLVKKASAEKTKKLEARGASNPTIRIALAGIPNCGKSTVINRLVGRNVAEVGNKPGVTKGQRWLKTSANIQVLDTPGILWPKFSDQEVGYKLAAFGAIKDSVFHADDVALFVLENLREHYLKNLVKFSKLNQSDIENLADADILLAMTEKYGMRDDYDRFSLFMLQRLRKGAIGRITLDRP
ncbi:ribosome biogenesis GTPase YlqF [Lactobacillus ultunensis]|uniref:Ribosome biogenesis GTPase A n=1 Tax=Lactobacillus ultunensis DSM 16047 TaxID=525365 RepID=C2EMZ0_9LACO|nr:ribosome biogenesis GTPase YlqF [Lactobacillus ultunensis]EEJ72093.1 ribosome biogenesis GTP-binding protein YlqF [Lactobacillus ultunensis DSM 16047]KRL80824.1 GTP-binding protein [Lactobacillus ultunensis DSM 16047]QQP27736.1 ribosome biogenesis GTPase YlqF [Lactobacillus ultunensis]